MRFATYAPPAPLGDFVDIIWIWEHPAPSHAKERLLPTGSMELVVNLADDSDAPVLAGAHSQVAILDTTRMVNLVGVHFKPGGAFPFVSMPASELRNLDVPLVDLWGSAARDLRNQLLECGSNAAAFAVMERYLLRRARTLSRHPAVAFALREFQRTRSVGEVVEATGISNKRFTDVFAAEVGLTPKLYCRVQRFQQVIQRIHRAPEVDWSEVALDCGYYDQPHFIHDFREFCGLTPEQYLVQRGEHLNHVPVRDA